MGVAGPEAGGEQRLQPLPLLGVDGVGEAGEECAGRAVPTWRPVRGIRIHGRIIVHGTDIAGLARLGCEYHEQSRSEYPY
ncbi:hypothetical protein GCM10011314_33100 [Knoellia flava]|uniref:Uncharacterized protein n=1 Tax=Knoellia flava TaxID=913969 RepID=A0A8H9FXS5_9MICO|nr:hypothetical protein GCM10011314_33100 [Knoellia flava]